MFLDDLIDNASEYSTLRQVLFQIGLLPEDPSEAKKVMTLMPKVYLAVETALSEEIG